MRDPKRRFDAIWRASKVKHVCEPDTEDDEGGETSDFAAGELDSGYEDEGASTASSVEESIDETSNMSGEDEVPKKRQKRDKQKVLPVKRSDVADASVPGQELWRPGIKTGLGPGVQVVFQRPKARENILEHRIESSVSDFSFRFGVTIVP